jgi:hypothetical protein
MPNESFLNVQNSQAFITMATHPEGAGHDVDHATAGVCDGRIFVRRATNWEFSVAEDVYHVVPGLSLPVNFRAERVVRITAGGHAKSDGQPMAVGVLVDGETVDCLGAKSSNPHFAFMVAAHPTSYYGYAHAFPKEWQEVPTERVVKVAAGLHKFEIGVCAHAGTTHYNAAWMQVEILPTGYTTDAVLIGTPVATV